MMTTTVVKDGHGDQDQDQDEEVESKMKQGTARSLFQLSRQDREFLSFNLMFRDANENFFLSVSCYETRTRISFFQSRASRQE